MYRPIGGLSVIGHVRARMLRLFRNWFNYAITVCVHGRHITTSSTGVPRQGRRSQTRGKCCGTKTLLVFLLALTLLVNLQFKVVDIGDYYSLTFSHDNFRGPCVLPILNPFDPGMMRTFKKLDSINCMQPEPPVFFDSDNVLQYNQSELVRRGLRSDIIQCRCSDVIRVNGDDWVEFSDDYECKIPFGYKQDFLKIKCKANSDTIFDSLLFNIHKNKSFGELRDDYYNVLLFGIDTVSRSSSIRNLENTLKYLKDDLGAFDFKGYMKIGGVTYPNIVAVLTGLLENELPIKDEINDFFDDIPAVWKSFSHNNYTTFYAEDLPLMNTFNLKKKGFRRSPVDHYMRPYWLGWHAINPVRDYKGGVSLDLLNVGLLKMGLEQYLCAGNVPNYVAQLQYLKRFFDTYSTERKFAFSFLVEIAHNNQNILNLADIDIYKFFKGLKEDGHLENTIVFMFSDHGPKTGETFYTARVEKSLPMQYIILPEKLKQSYPQIPKHLAENAKKLTTHFDLHATLRDVLHRNFRSPTKFVKNGAVRGYSLFGQMPAERSCAGKLVV